MHSIQISRISRALSGRIALALASAALPGAASASQLTVELAFTGASGAIPANGNLLVQSGAVYAATFAGGFADLGAIVSVPTSVPASNAPTPTVLHSFSGADGSHPNGSLVSDAQGNLYGTTANGGAAGLGTVFKLTKPSAGVAWSLTTLHSFSGPDGANPGSGVTLGPDGSIYGTTLSGGAFCGPSGCGTVFKITPAGGFVLEHSFSGPNGNGSGPERNIVLSSTGVMYGTTSGGFGFFSGTLYQISAAGTNELIMGFTFTNGGVPRGNIVRDSAGNIYGTFWQGESTANAQPSAEVFEVTPPSKKLVILAQMPGQTTTSGIVRDNAGNIYGTLTGVPTPPINGVLPGGRDNGSVFMLSPKGIVTTLAALTPDTQGPAGGVVLDSSGNLWGTSSGGGIQCFTAANATTSGCGTIFEVTP